MQKEFNKIVANSDNSISAKASVVEGKLFIETQYNTYTIEKSKNGFIVTDIHYETSENVVDMYEAVITINYYIMLENHNINIAKRHAPKERNEKIILSFKI